jgi:hypothetical protein
MFWVSGTYISNLRMRFFVFTKCLTPCFLCSGAPFGSPVQTFDSISNPCFLEVSFKTPVLLIRIRSDRHHFGGSETTWYPCQTNVKLKKNLYFYFCKENFNAMSKNIEKYDSGTAVRKLKRRKILFSNMCHTVLGLVLF